MVYRLNLMKDHFLICKRWGLTATGGAIGLLALSLERKFALLMFEVLPNMLVLLLALLLVKILLLLFEVLGKGLLGLVLRFDVELL